ncbi:unnamed protein product [Nesidiocoris tenuis]|uniref:PAS domain-containing protein n=1 Tax=Nesidiocoris tenuis TaxID=355587 RepID=A0A6H5H4E5_9HEMI|nr:unnamed protein product [Nesidiocoris tenuis]
MTSLSNPTPSSSPSIHLNPLQSIDLRRDQKPMAIADETSETSKQFEDCYLKASGGFVMVLSMEQDIVFVSQNVSSFLGISQVDLLGQNLMDISHPCDHSEIRELFTAKLMTERKSFFFRMKCVSSKGRGINTKSSSFKVLHTVGRFIKMGESSNEDFTFIALATPIPHPVDIEIPLGTFTFLSKHSLDMKYTYADDRMEEFMGYKREDLIGRSLFEFHHAQDYKNIERAFKGLFTKGQFDTGQYRFLAQGGGYVWVSTQATVIYNEKNGKPQSVVCVNYVIRSKYDHFPVCCSLNDKTANAARSQTVPRPLLDMFSKPGFLNAL